MTKKELTCIGCPMGCQLIVQLEEGEVVSVSGNICGVGEKYARKELTNPTRIVTSTICVEGGRLAMVSVKTTLDVPKEKINEVIYALSSICIKAPVTIGDVILTNVAGTGSDVIATKNILAR